MQGDFSQECAAQMSNQQMRRVKDWRLDYDLRMACKGDVASVRPPPPLFPISNNLSISDEGHIQPWPCQ